MKKQYSQPKLTVFLVTTGNLLTGSTESGVYVDKNGTITSEDGFATNKKHPIWGED